MNKDPVNNVQVKLDFLAKSLSRVAQWESELKDLKEEIFSTFHMRLSDSISDIRAEITSLDQLYTVIQNSKVQLLSTSSGFFSLLPPEIILHIFSLLSPTTLLTCRKVNWEFRKYSDEDVLWKEHCRIAKAEVFWTANYVKDPDEEFSDMLWRDVFIWHQKSNKKIDLFLTDTDTADTPTQPQPKPPKRELGRYHYTDSSVYRGEWKNGERHGKGIQTWQEGDSYRGQWRNGKRSGYGVHTWPDGHCYRGYYDDDKRNGLGTFIWPDKREYRGNYKGDQRNGHGEFIWPNGDKYVGNYEKSNRNGTGIFSWSDGRRYTGGWKDGSYHGYGIYTHRDGCQYKGEWKENMRHGHGTFFWPDGDYFEGQWVEGKRTGAGTFHKQTPAGIQHIEQNWNEEKFNKRNKGAPGVVEYKKRSKPDGVDSEDTEVLTERKKKLKHSSTEINRS